MFINNKGISLIESMIAVFLTAIAIIALMPMQDMSLRTAYRSDYVGRATMILQSELELQEAFIMRTNNLGAIVIGTLPTRVVRGSNVPGVAGDITFNIVTTVRANPASPANSFLVNARVTWPPMNTIGITSSIIVKRQMEGFE